MNAVHSYLSIGEVSALNSPKRKSYGHFKLMPRFLDSGVFRKVTRFFRGFFARGGSPIGCTGNGWAGARFDKVHKERLGWSQVRQGVCRRGWLDPTWAVVSKGVPDLNRF